MHYEVYPKNEGYRSDEIGGTSTPKQFPCVELVHNYDWNDYGDHNWYAFWYFVDSKTYRFLGNLKIMTTRETTTADALGDGWDGALDSSFCSLGMRLEYYQNLYAFFGNKNTLYEILEDLRDCAYNPRIYEDFHENSEFEHSLWRDLAPQEAQKSGRAIVTGRKPEDAYTFCFTGDIIQSDDSHQNVDLEVKFPFNGQIYTRTMCIIGENGMGKTQLLSQLASSLITRERLRFNRVPIFNGCLVVCSTPLDCYPIRTGNELIHYLNISIEQKNEQTADDLAKAIETILTRPSVFGKRMETLYREAIVAQLGEELCTFLEWEEDPAIPWEGQYKLNKEELGKIVKIVSSGQLHLLSLISYIYANIHFATLLIIDEPEVHLHPHTVVEFMRILASILMRFKSYAIIATHSPLIVREVISSNVQVLRKVDGDMLNLSPVAYNTFGEDITTLYYKIFDYNIKDSFFTQIIKQMVDNGMSYDEIISKLEPDVDLSLNARMTIRDLTSGTAIRHA